MGYGEKVKKWFFDEDGDGEDIAEDYDAVEVDTVPKTSLFEQAKLSKTSEAVKSLNMNKDSHLAKRVVDFLSGVIYAIEGDIQRIGPKIFLCTPRNISVAGTIDLDEDEQED